MDIDQLAARVIKSAATTPRYIVAIAGPPGAGKSTFAERLKDHLVVLGHNCKVVSMDGFHLDNSVLEQRGLLARKGAPETFDVGGFTLLIERLAKIEDQTFIPVFDRDRDLAIAGADCISANDKILLVEGNYLMLNISPWFELQKYWMETVFINPGVQVLKERLHKRWLDHGLDTGDAQKRVSTNDIPNMKCVIENSAPANISIA